MTFPIIPASTVNGGYQISRSLRFRSSASAYLSRTSGTSSNQSVGTLSFWMKAAPSISSTTQIPVWCNTGNAGMVAWNTTSYGGKLFVRTDATNDVLFPLLFRDPSAWYHCVIAVDTTQSTAANRVRLYVNGVQQTASSGTAALNSTNFNSSSTVYNIGKDIGNNWYWDGYLSEYNFLDGYPTVSGTTYNATTWAALNVATLFGSFDTNGVWQPARYTGSYGTNGFYLNFSDNSGATATTIGKDSSGNSNNWTPNNISLTSGTTYDSMIDSPTNYADGGNGRGNYPTLNPVAKTYALGTKSDGNLSLVGDDTNYCQGLGTIAVPTSGKWYWEVTATIGVSGAERRFAGVWSTKNFDFASNVPQESTQGAVHYYALDGCLASNSAYPFPAYGATWTTGNVIGIAVNVDSGQITFYKDNAAQGTATLPSNMQGVPLYPSVISKYIASGLAVNFGQRPFTYTPPSGFSALNTQNLPTPTITNGALYMAATLYTGTGSALTVLNSTNSGNNPLGVSFQPDFVWVKSRSAATNNVVSNTIVPNGNTMFTNTTAAEAAAPSLYNIGSVGGVNGFLVQNFDGTTDTNGATYVAWQWKGGGGTGVTNTSGSITSTVSANTSAGFSVVTWTGTGATGTIGHGLGVAPSFIIVKARSAAGEEWYCYHVSLGATARVQLNSTAAQTTGTSVWNSTSPTSTVFSIGNGNPNTSSVTYVAYCFAPVAGYSAFGSYTGNGSTDGPFVYTGFRPRWLMIKATNTAAENWYVLDTSRDTYNTSGLYLFPSANSAEADYRSTYPVDFLSNGFKIRNNAYPNTSAITYIYAAFAENPFKNSRAR